MNIIIVEDDHLMALFLDETLDNLGCDVVKFFDEGAPLLDYAADHPIDLVIMDVDIKGNIDGISLAEELRSRYNVPSFFITSHNDNNTINRAMQTEPLGYVVKPVTVKHIESAVNVVKATLGKEISPRRNWSTDLTSLGKGYRYDFRSKNLFHNDQPIDLTPSESKLFDLCMRSKGYCVPYAMVNESVWGSKMVSASSRRGLYYRLRNKLNYQFFETVSGVGCRIKLQ